MDVAASDSLDLADGQNTAERILLLRGWVGSRGAANPPQSGKPLPYLAGMAKPISAIICLISNRANSAVWYQTFLSEPNSSGLWETAIV